MFAFLFSNNYSGSVSSINSSITASSNGISSIIVSDSSNTNSRTVASNRKSCHKSTIIGSGNSLAQHIPVLEKSVHHFCRDP